MEIFCGNKLPYHSMFRIRKKTINKDVLLEEGVEKQKKKGDLFFVVLEEQQWQIILNPQKKKKKI
ncbi:hypothetical protein [Acinetobacter baumannii]